ncbi:MAG: hypothetical protein RH917_05640 [Lacipirellulaceae bacterium]
MKRNCFAKLMLGFLMGVTLFSMLAGSSLLRAAHPCTPAPCAADGTCRPKTESWGYWQTHWRPFPGDDAAAAAGQQLVPEPAGEDEGLGGFVRPQPSKEDQAGPEEQERDPEVPAEDGGLGDPAAPGDGSEPLPALDPLGLQIPNAPDFQAALPPEPPAFLKQLVNPAANVAPSGDSVIDDNVRPAGYRPPANRSQDAPPSLPPSLERVAQLTGMLEPLPPVKDALKRDSAVMQTSAQAIPAESTTGIRVINPTSAYAAQPGEGGLQQAIYFEASEK